MSDTGSALTGSALQASKAALSAALAENKSAATDGRTDEELLATGEIQEVDMQGQADAIRTVFSDPTNFNVKVRSTFVSIPHSSNLVN